MCVTYSLSNGLTNYEAIWYGALTAGYMAASKKKIIN